jgi:hypothetical protein
MILSCHAANLFAGTCPTGYSEVEVGTLYVIADSCPAGYADVSSAVWRPNGDSGTFSDEAGAYRLQTCDWI